MLAIPVRQPGPFRPADPACHPCGTDPGHLRVVLPAEGAGVRAPARVHSRSSVLLPGAHLLAVLRSLRRGNGTHELHGRLPGRCTPALQHPVSTQGLKTDGSEEMHGTLYGLCGFSCACVCSVFCACTFLYLRQ